MIPFPEAFLFFFLLCEHERQILTGSTMSAKTSQEPVSNVTSISFTIPILKL